MNEEAHGPRGPSIHIAHDAIGSQLVVGDRNRLTSSGHRISLPAQESVDMRLELDALRAELARLATVDHRKIDNAFNDAADELDRETPDRDEVGRALDRALSYAQKAEGFAAVVTSLQPHITNATAWLGHNWDSLLSRVGLMPGS